MNEPTNGRRKQMDLSRLDEMIEVLEVQVEGEEDWGQLKHADLSLILSYLNYLRDKTENNRLYHKKQNQKKNMAIKRLKELLSKDELDELDAQVEESLR